MDDALLNCMTGVCCPPAAQALALAEWMVREYGIDRHAAKACAEAMVEHFDFAEKGALRPLVESVLRLHGAK